MSRNQSPVTTERLLKQYPALMPDYASQVLHPRNEGIPVKIYIRVRRAGYNFMFRKGQCVFGHGNHILHSDTHEIGLRYEYITPAHKGGTRGEIRSWLTHDFYVRDLFGQPITDWGKPNDAYAAPFAEDPFDVIGNFILTTVVEWFPKEADPHALWRHPTVRRDVELTVFLAPKQGWRELYEAADPQKNITLHGRDLLLGTNNDEDKYVRLIRTKLDNLAKVFEQQVWNGGLRSAVHGSTKESQKWNLDGIQLLVGRHRGFLPIELRRGDIQFVMNGHDDRHVRLSCELVEGTGEQLDRLVSETISRWRELDEQIRRSLTASA